MNNFIQKFKRSVANASCGSLGFLLLASMVVPVIAVSAELPGPSADVADNSVQPDGGALTYRFIAGSTFHPLDSSTSYSYEGSGCISKTVGSALFVHKVLLPQGSLVRYLRLYAYDTSTSAVTSFFTTYDGAGAFNQLTSIASVNAGGGYGSELSPQMTFNVDHYTSAINVTVNMGIQNNNTLRFCGVRIAYDADGVSDYIFANGFD